MNFMHKTIFKYFVTGAILFFMASSCLKEEVEEPIEIPEVNTITLSNITGNTAIGGGLIINDGGSEIMEYGLVWSTSRNVGLHNYSGIINKDNNQEEFTAEIKDLEPFTNYFIRAYATNKQGTGFGDELHFFTKSGVDDGQFGQACSDYPTVTDIDGNEYQTVKIGEQCWMAENLRTTTFYDGTEIVQLDSLSAADTVYYPAFVVFDHSSMFLPNINSESEMLEIYGALYNWHAVNDSANICPEGWTVPSDNDWETLISKVSEINSDNIANQLKSCRQVNSPIGGVCNINQHPRWSSHEVHFGNNNYGFDALPGGGIASDTTVSLLRVGYGAYWWTATQHHTGITAVARLMQYMRGDVSRIGNANKKNFYGVRCIKK